MPLASMVAPITFCLFSHHMPLLLLEHQLAAMDSPVLLLAQTLLLAEVLAAIP